MADNEQSYNVARIRDLLLRAFTPEELRRFCQDHPMFSPVVVRFGPEHGLDDMVAEVIDYCQTQLLFNDLLDGVRRVNPRRYARLQPYRHAPAVPLSGAPGKPRPLSTKSLRSNWIARVLIVALMVLVVAIGVILWKLLSPLGSDVAPTFTPTDSPPPSITTTSTPLADPTSAGTPSSRPTPSDMPSPTRTSTDAPPPAPTFTPTPVPPPTCQFEPDGEFVGLWQTYKSQLGCPLYPTPKAIQDGEQLFDNGRMFWRPDNEQIYVVYEQGALSGTYQVFPDQWEEGAPEYSCAATPPADRLQPKLGFGLVWCNLGGSAAAIGWALEEGTGFWPGNGDPLVQDFGSGVIFRDSTGTASGMAYVLLGNGGAFVRVTY